MPQQPAPRCATTALILLAVSPWSACAQTGRAQEASPTPRRPNVLLIITDDQGYGDISSHGNGVIQTPHLDELRASSVRLTDFHVDPTCSPSRSALMTGRYSTRTGVWHTIMGRSLMDTREETLAEYLRADGYRTGMFGKWHLGDNSPLRPQDQGFEHVCWHHGGGVGQGPDYWGNDYFDDTYDVNGTWQPFEGYCTDVWFREAAEFIAAKDDERPFFAYVATNAPHHPYFVDESYSKPYVDAGVPKTMADFYGMVTNIDDNVGRMLARLEELGERENTIVVFMTDNGTAAGHRKREKEEGTWSGFNAGMRGNKGSEYDGGHRVPFFVHWPAGGIEGGRDIDALTAHVDVLPTLLEMTGVSLEAKNPIDGASLAPALRGAAPAPGGRTLFVHSQRLEHPRKWRKSAVMTDQWRLVNGTELFDIDADPAQTTDLAGAHPDRVASMRASYDDWWASLAPAMESTVRIALGGDENPVHLMSHDWHSGKGGTPWHQNHVRRGHVANGPWAVDVREAGDYEITLRRWPEQLDKAMDATAATVSIGNYNHEVSLDPSATSATFKATLERGPADLLTSLTGNDGKVRGAYFVAAHRLDR